MQLDVRTIYLMYAVLYLMLHGIIWFSLSRYQSMLVRRWSLAGIVSATGIGLFSLVGVLPDWAVASLGQVLMAAGNFGRQHVLRSVDGPPSARWVWGQGLFHLTYLLFNGSLFSSGASNAQMMLVFFVFYALTCLDFYFSGRAIARRRTTMGALSLQMGGLVFTVSLGIKAIAMSLGWGAQDFYEPGWDQVALFAAQILAVSLLNFGFMQILVDQFQQERSQAESALLLQRERAGLAERQSQQLAKVLREREEIIRQLTLSSKTAGMGALVSGIAHEINQPLTTIVLKSELIETYLHDPPDVQEVRKLCSKIREDAHHAGGMIRTLRNMFSMGRGGYGRFDFVELLRSVTDIVRNRTEHLGITLELELPPALKMMGDSTQLQQVVLNLLNNAIEAIQLNRVVRSLPGHPHRQAVALESAAVSPRIILQCLLNGSQVELRVQDNGCGILPESREDVFALFKSPANRDMGVGLWLSHSVVEAHGGTLTFESTPGQGTVFLLRMPAREDAVHGEAQILPCP